MRLFEHESPAKIGRFDKYESKLNLDKHTFTNIIKNDEPM